jgi:uncharacterized protein (DUF1330 family)
MKIKRKEALRKLKQTKSGLAKKEIVEQTGSYLFKDGKVTTYNDEISMSTPLVVGFQGAVKAEKFYKALEGAPTANVDVTADNERVFIRSGEMVAEIEKAEILLPIQDVPQPDPSDCVSLAPDFKEKVKLAAGAASKNFAKQVLCCIHMWGNIIEATDNYRIVRCRTDVSLPEGLDLLIPKDSISSLLKLNPTALAYANGWASFQTEEGVIFSCRVLDAVFIDTEPALTRACESPIYFPPAHLTAILDRAVQFADNDSVGDPKVTISVKDDLLMVQAAQEGSRFRETCKVSFRGSLKFHANPLFLRDALAMNFDKACFSRHGTRIYMKFEKESVTYLLVLGNADANVPTISNKQVKNR